MRLARLVGTLLALSCAGSAGSPIELPPGSGVEPGADAVLGFYARTQAFYARLAQRRLNARRQRLTHTLLLHALRLDEQHARPASRQP